MIEFLLEFLSMMITNIQEMEEETLVLLKQIGSSKWEKALQESQSPFSQTNIESLTLARIHPAKPFGTTLLSSTQVEHMEHQPGMLLGNTMLSTKKDTSS